LAESHKLDPWPLDEGSRPKSGKLRLNLYDTILEGKSIDSGQKQRVQRRDYDLENQDASQVQGRIRLKDSIRFK